MNWTIRQNSLAGRLLALLLAVICACCAAWGGWLPDAWPQELLRPVLLLVFLVLAVSGTLVSAELPSLGRRILKLAFLAALSVALYSLTPPQGLMARYYDSPDWRGVPQRSIDYLGFKEWTRIDRRLHFRGITYGGDWSPFPLYFFDSHRYNFYREDQPRRTMLPFSATWEGYLDAGTAPRRIRISCDALSTAALSVNGTRMPGNGPVTEAVVGPGSVRLSVDFCTRALGSPGLDLSWLEGGRWQTVGERNFRPSGAPPLAAGRLLPWLLALAGLILIGQLFRPAWSALSSPPGLVFVSALLLGLGYHMARFLVWGRPVIIPVGGNDDLTYLAFARDILLEGHPGEAVFYYAPLYRYFLAGVQLLLGEGLTSVAAAQQLLRAAAVAGVYLLGAQLLSLRAGWMGALLTLASPALLRLAEQAFIETLALFLYCACALAAVTATVRRHTLDFFLLGLLAGLAAVARPNALLFLFVLPIYLALNMPRRILGKAIGLVFLGALMAILPATLKNLNGGQFALISSNGPINLWIGNNPQATGFYMNPPDVSGKRYIVAVIQHVLGNPKKWLKLEWLKLQNLWAIGFRPYYLCLLIGMCLSHRRLPWRRLMLLDLIIVTALATQLMFFVHERFVLPFLPFMLLYLGLGLDCLWPGNRLYNLGRAGSAAKGERK